MNYGNGYGGNSPYGVAPGYAPQQQPYGQPYGAPVYGQAPMMPMYGQPMYPQAMPMMPMIPPKNGGLAIGLELGMGTCFQTFGVGHLYAGNVGMGLGLMFGYWFLTFVNILLCGVLVGFITWPLTWVAFMILSSITANNAVKEANRKLGYATA